MNNAKETNEKVFASATQSAVQENEREKTPARKTAAKPKEKELERDMQPAEVAVSPEKTAKPAKVAKPEKATKGETAQTPAYKREDCEEGKITDADEIAELRRNQRIDILQNAMLGEYAPDGVYVLPDEIRDELIKAKKTITNNYENYIFAQTLKPIGEYGRGKFFVTVSKLEAKLCAVLTFVEPVHKVNRLVTNAQASEIATFIDNANEQFYYNMKKEFNIVDDDYVYPEDVDEFRYSTRRKKQRIALWRESLRAIERTEKQIFETRMAVLNKQSNEYSNSVKSLFNDAMKKRGSFLGRAPSPSLCLNQLLDECIDIMHGKLPKLEIPFVRAMREATRAIGLEQTREIDNNKAAILAELGKGDRAKTIPKDSPRRGRGREEDARKLGGDLIMPKNLKQPPNAAEAAEGTLAPPSPEPSPAPKPTPRPIPRHPKDLTL